MMVGAWEDLGIFPEGRTRLTLRGRRDQEDQEDQGDPEDLVDLLLRRQEVKIRLWERTERPTQEWLRTRR